MQDDSLRGLLHGIYIRASGILLKPMSGCFSLVSELCTGASGKIKAWGEDSRKRPPIGRIRPPRQFSALSADMGGRDHHNFALCSPKALNLTCSSMCSHAQVGLGPVLPAAPYKGIAPKKWQILLAEHALASPGTEQGCGGLYACVMAETGMCAKGNLRMPSWMLAHAYNP